MKKILALLLALLLILAMAVPAYAVTPKYEIPEVPQISKIKFDIKIELPDDFWDFIEINWKPCIPTDGDDEMVGAVSRWMP